MPVKKITVTINNILPKLIHSDQKGFVKGRDISEASRLIKM